LWGGGCVKGAFQVVHSHGSIEVMLTKSSPSPVQQHCAGLPKACSNQIWERVATLLFPAWNGDQENSLWGEGEPWQAAESLLDQCGFEAVV
jgi:hypothetical protein